MITEDKQTDHRRYGLDSFEEMIRFQGGMNYMTHPPYSSRKMPPIEIPFQ
jgi:hypothetical protein